MAWGTTERNERMGQSSTCDVGLHACMYHSVIIPKYIRKVLYGKLKERIDNILGELFRKKVSVLTIQTTIIR